MTYPPDIQQSYEVWGANCGPCSLAAVLNLSVNDVRGLFDGFESRGYTNPTHLKAALDRARVKYRAVGPNLPRYGLAFIQWGGHETKPIKAQYRFTHWIGIAGEVVFEVNAPHLTTFQSWRKIMPAAIKEEGQGNGAYSIRAGIEVLSLKERFINYEPRDGRLRVESVKPVGASTASIFPHVYAPTRVRVQWHSLGNSLA
jgi:hypothetical protein